MLRLSRGTDVTFLEDMKIVVAAFCAVTLLFLVSAVIGFGFHVGWAIF